MEHINDILFMPLAISELDDIVDYIENRLLNAKAADEFLEQVDELI